MPSSPACLGQPPLPTNKKPFTRLLSFPSFRKGGSASPSPTGSMLRKYSLRRKQHADTGSSCTYQSFSRDLQADASSFVFGGGSETPFADAIRRQPSVRFVDTAAAGSTLTLNRCQSDSNISSVSADTAVSRVRSRPKTASFTANDEDFKLKTFGGSWKNLLNVAAMNGRGHKNPPQIKKVAPPAVPESAVAGFRNSSSSFGSAGYSSCGEDNCFVDPVREGYTEAVVSGSGKPATGPGPDVFLAHRSHANSHFSFPTNHHHQGVCIAGKTVYYHHQYSLADDQGIDMTQSPGRDSPGSSGSGSRHSTTSVDSGRASGSNMTSASRSSASTSSIGSVPEIHNIPAKVDYLIRQGVPDTEVLRSWLSDIHFDEYYPNFASAGYDMNTIIRMMPEDLTAIGIKKPHHRNLLKTEISRLNVSDGLPTYIPERIDEFLKLLRLDEYRDTLISQNYHTTMDALQLSWDDLEDIGIVKLGHQKRLLLGIKRISDLKNGKKFYPTNLNVIQTRVCVENNASASSPSCSATSPSFSDFDFPQRSYHSFNGNWECPNDIVPIKVRNERGKSLESLKDVESENLTSSFVGNITSVLSPSKVTENNGPWKLRSFEDGDVTPTNEVFSGGTLPRPRSLVKPRPVAKIPANVCSTYRTQEYISENDALKKPPCPPKRDTMVHVIADFHCAQTPPEPAPSTPPWKLEERKLIHSLKSNHGSDSSFHSNSSADSDSMPFANDNAGTIKQKSVKFACDYPPTNIVSPQSTKKSSLKFSSQKQDPIDVLDDIGNMLANLTDELDAMLEEEKRQGLIQD